MNKSTDMLATLRAKFVALNMACVAVVVAVSFSAVCYSEYKQDVAEVYQSMQSSIDAAVQAGARSGDMPSLLPNSGEQPLIGEGKTDSKTNNDEAVQGNQSNNGNVGASQKNSEQQSSSNGGSTNNANSSASSESDETSNDDNHPAAPRIGGGQGQTIPVAIYTVTGENAQATASPFGTADIDDSVLSTACERLASTEDNSGTMADLGLFYQKSTQNGTVYIAFADTASANGWESLAWTLAGVGIIVIAVFFIISVFFARWALAPVQRAWRSQRQFIADASHELKTPLTVILADASIALEKPQATVESQRKWIEGIQEEGVRMRGLVEDMLALAKHDAAAADTANDAGEESFDLAEIAQRGVLQFEAVAFERGVEISDSCTPAEVRGSKTSMQRVVGVLLDNACKYADANESGSASGAAAQGGRVDVRVTREGKHAVLRVSNTGEPITPEAMEHIFDRFWRADEARTSGKGGYGLGLAIAKSIVEEHGGKLEVSSTQAATTFTATLPLAK